MLEDIFKQYGSAILTLIVFVLLVAVVAIIGGTKGASLAPFFQNILNSITNLA